MEPDLSEFDSGESVGGDRPCIVGLVLSELDEERHAKLTAALNKQVPIPTIKHKWVYSHERVAVTINAWGFKLAPCAVGRHRRGVCTCPR